MLRIDHNFPELHPSSLSASHGEPRTKVHILVCERRLLRVDRRVLWWGHNAINVYHIPWRREVDFQDMGIGRTPARQDRVNNKGDRGCHPKDQTDIQIPRQPARLCTEEEASEWLTEGAAPWYYAQGLEPPTAQPVKTGKKGR